jgi:hypothetical protein
VKPRRAILAVALLGASACLPPPRDETPLPDVKQDGAVDAATDAAKTTDTGPADTDAKDGELLSDTATATDASSDTTPTIPGATGCTTDAPCVQLLAGLKCKVGKCNLATGLCEAQNAEDGSACIGDKCNEKATCQLGACAGKAPNCDDKNDCTIDACVSGKGCVHWPAVKNCDDGQKCTVNDHCENGACKGDAKPCDDDGSPCTVESCNAASGECKADAAAAGTACVDDGKCKGPGECKGKTCVAKSLCEDGNPCTFDLCNAGKCSHFALVAGSSCTPAGAQPDACNPGTCQVDLASAPTCTTKPKCDDGKACTKDECSGGSCKFVPVELADAVSCDDGNPLTVGEMCAKGTCACGFSGEIDCKYDDLNPCTDDKCTSQAGCVSTPNSAKCGDGSACTTNDTCKDGKCTGTAVACDDKNPCTQDACDPLEGCTHKVQQGAACSNGKLCDAQGVCK